MRSIFQAVAGVVVALIASAAHAATIVSVSPQGEVAQVRQVSVKFSEAVVPFGDLRQPHPVAVSCQGAALASSGRASAA